MKNQTSISSSKFIKFTPKFNWRCLLLIMGEHLKTLAPMKKIVWSSNLPNHSILQISKICNFLNLVFVKPLVLVIDVSIFFSCHFSSPQKHEFPIQCKTRLRHNGQPSSDGVRCRQMRGDDSGFVQCSYI